MLLVRVDATESDGWFYEGAGIYRHVWLVKTHPVHVKQWGTFVASDVKPDTATLSIRTEVEQRQQQGRERAGDLDHPRPQWQAGRQSGHAGGSD